MIPCQMCDKGYPNSYTIEAYNFQKLLHLLYKRHKTSLLLRSYAFYKEDEEVFGNYMLQSCRNLDSLYRTFDKESFRIKLQRKNQLIIDIILGIKLLSLHRPERYIFHYPIKQLPNNAWFLSFKRYRSRQLDLEQKLRIAFHDDLKAYVGDIKNQAR